MDLGIAGITALETKTPAPDWDNFEIRHYPLQNSPAPEVGALIQWAGEQWRLGAIDGNQAKLLPPNSGGGSDALATALIAPLSEVLAL